MGKFFNGSIEARLGKTTIIDTGSTLLLLENHICDNLYSTITGYRFEEGLWYIPSSATDIHLPSLNFDIGGKEYKTLKSHLRSLCVSLTMLADLRLRQKNTVEPASDERRRLQVMKSFTVNRIALSFFTWAIPT